MRNRRLLAILIAFVITIAATAMWSASTIQREGDGDANILEDSGSTAGETPEKKKGNKVVRVIAAPFKAFGRLFRKDKDDKKFNGLTEKDQQKFETVAVTRVEDSRTQESRKVSVGASAKEFLANGRESLVNGRLNDAIAELTTAISLDPKLNEAHSLLGVAYTRKGLGERAKESYERAVKVEPEDAQALNNLGWSLYQNGNYRAAVDRLKRAAKLAPTDERIMNNLALALCRLGRFEDAYKSFARAGGQLTGNLNTGRMLERFGRDDDAIKYYEAARRIDGNSTIALRRLTDLYKRTGRPEQAQAASSALEGVSAVAAVGR